MRNEETMCEGLLSVVIPVYNIRDYVERCVRSVLAQPDVPLEVLIVDDGSTDDSGAVCDALAAEDSRVTVIHKPNGGLSDARNCGLCHAQGEYILFMDGDDWLTENVCPGLLQMALQTRADVVIGKAHFLREEPVMTRWEEAVEKNFTFHTIYTGKEYLLKCLQTGGLRVEVGRHLYRTGFLRANGLQFCKGILHEDEEFTPRVLLQAQRVVLTGQEIYYYDNCRAGSITHAEGLSTRRVQDRLRIYDSLAEIYRTVTPRALRRRLQDDLSWKYLDCAARFDCRTLPGYRPAQSMVYCGIYTEDGSKYPDLRDALEKLQLNDASLTFEPESSVALGFGFRCGFLGMLHMEIIQERLEREFNLDLVTTLPSVIYHVYKSDGTMVKVDNPHNYPDPGTIEHAEEPYVKVSIIAPNEFVGNIMPMCQERRGEFKDMQYLDTHLVELHYQMPLNEIIYDFFDTLKANTKGYASLDYELSGYRTSDLVKVDLLLNGDGVDALSFIAHRDKAYPRARRLCEKLKENIPRQLFEVPIQAAIGGRIIARETVKAMRKDVLAKCYGGDITRKKKLLEKQKEGKKKMRNLGTVQVPTEAFMAVLKLDSD
jgi:glycosyltransferase involved in cell wall biosynthesis